MLALRLGLVGFSAGLAWGVPSLASACGGFFCDSIDPVVQTAERILFRVNDDDTVTAIVEIQFAGPPSQFAWVLPVSPGLQVEDLGTVPAGLFDELELRTAPVFERPVYAEAAALADEGGGCGAGLGRFGKRAPADTPPPPDTSGVEVVGAAVVGPYALEIITAEQGENLSNWLLINGYQIPQSAVPAMNHYIGLKLAFLGIKLQADVPAGPIDPLSFTYPGNVPAIPLILTAVAAAERMEILAYVAGPGRHVPGNYTDLAFDYQTVRWTGATDTDYLRKLDAAVGVAGGRAFNTEFAEVIGETGKLDDTPLAEVLQRGDYVTRFHTFMSAGDMSVDPYWIPGVSADDVDNHHVLADDDDGEVEEDGHVPATPGPGPGGLATLLLVPVVLTLRRRPPVVAT